MKFSSRHVFLYSILWLSGFSYFRLGTRQPAIIILPYSVFKFGFQQYGHKLPSLCDFHGFLDIS